MAKGIAKRLIYSAGGALHDMRPTPSGQRIGILMYHRVVDPVQGFPQPTWNVTPAAFRAQLVGLLDRGFRALPLAQLIEDCQRGFSLPAGAFVITFDDGQASVYRHAYPILKELAIPATLFLPTAFIDRAEPFPFDDWAAAGSPAVPPDTWRPMTDAECRAIAADGLVELGAHTHTHLDAVEQEDAFESDLATNARELEHRFGLRRPAFAFPFGKANARLLDCVRRMGFSCALKVGAELVDPRREPYGWGRFNVEAWDTAATLSARLNGWCSWVASLRRRFIELELAH